MLYKYETFLMLLVCFHVVLIARLSNVTDPTDCTVNINYSLLYIMCSSLD